MYANDSSIDHSGYYSYLSSLAAVEVASGVPAGVACTSLTTQAASLSFTLNSGASRCFFRGHTDLTPLRNTVTIALADSSVGAVVAHSTTTLPYGVTGAPLATFPRDPGSVVPSRPKPSGVSHVTLQSSPPQGPVLVVSGGAGGAVAEGEGTRAAGAGGVGPGGAGGVGVEVTLVEDTAASTRRPRPVSFLGFPYVPQFPPRSSLRPVGAEPGGVPARGIGGLGGVGGGGAGSGGAGAGGTGTVAPTSCTVRFLTREQRLLRLEREECERFERAQQQQQQHQQQEHFSCTSRREKRRSHSSRRREPRRGHDCSSRCSCSCSRREQRRNQECSSACSCSCSKGRGGATQQQEVKVPSQQTPEEAGQQRLRLHDLPDPAPTRLVRGPLPSPRVPPIQSLSSSQWTRRSPLSRVVSPEPCWSHYRADGLLHLVLRSCTPPPLVLPQPLESSLSIFHDPLSDYLRASRPIVSRVLSALVTHATAPPSFVSVLVPHLYALLLVPEGDPDALVTPIPRTHAKAVLGPGFRNG
ncbi:unnamed protein product [Closterium sp. NIES-54]